MEFGWKVLSPPLPFEDNCLTPSNSSPRHGWEEAREMANHPVCLGQREALGRRTFGFKARTVPTKMDELVTYIRSKCAQLLSSNYRQWDTHRLWTALIMVWILGPAVPGSGNLRNLLHHAGHLDHHWQMREQMTEPCVNGLV